MTKLFTAQAKTLPISVTTTASASTALPEAGTSLRVSNEGPDDAFFSVGVGAQTATLPNATPTGTSTPVLAGADMVFSIPDSDDPLNISAITRSGTATLDCQVGEGE